MIYMWKVSVRNVYFLINCFESRWFFIKFFGLKIVGVFRFLLYSCYSFLVVFVIILGFRELVLLFYFNYC